MTAPAIGLRTAAILVYPFVDGGRCGRATTDRRSIACCTLWGLRIARNFRAFLRCEGAIPVDHFLGQRVRSNRRKCDEYRGCNQPMAQPGFRLPRRCMEMPTQFTNTGLEGGENPPGAGRKHRHANSSLYCIIDALRRLPVQSLTGLAGRMRHPAADSPCLCRQLGCRLTRSFTDTRDANTAPGNEPVKISGEFL